MWLKARAAWPISSSAAPMIRLRLPAPTASAVRVNSRSGPSTARSVVHASSPASSAATANPPARPRHQITARRWASALAFFISSSLRMRIFSAASCTLR